MRTNNEKNYAISMCMSFLIDARLELVENPYSGEVEECFVIPMAKNPSIEKTVKGNVYIHYYAKALDYPRKNKTHVLFPYYTKEMFETIKEVGYRKRPYFGSMRSVDFE